MSVAVRALRARKPSGRTQLVYLHHRDAHEHLKEALERQIEEVHLLMVHRRQEAEAGGSNAQTYRRGYRRMQRVLERPLHRRRS